MAIDNTLLGVYDKEDSKIQRAVYRVKNANDNGYTRVHFETSSRMIHDATSKATGYKVARRDQFGSIEFTDITANGLTKTNTLDVTSTSTLNGETTIGGGVAANKDALIVPKDKNTSLGGALKVTGASTFTGKTTHLGGAEIQNGATISSGKLTVSAGGASISGDLVVNAGSNVIANSNLTVNGNTTLGTADHKKTTTINGTAKINKLEVAVDSKVANLNADRVDDCHVNDTSAPAVNTLWTAKKVDDTKANKSVTVTASERLAIEGNNTLGGNISIKHTKGKPNRTEAGTTSFVALKSMAFDDWGHPTSYVETDLDARYPLKTNTVKAGSGLNGEGQLGQNIVISHNSIKRSDTTSALNTAGTTCNVLSSITSDENGHGHIKAVNTVNLDERYYTRDLTDREIENRINNVVQNNVILRDPLDGTVNGTSLKMEGFTMQFNKSANAIEFVFV